MNLGQAYLGWQQQSENRKLYMNTREAFRKAWFTLPTNKPCSYYTREVLGTALAETREVDSVKAKAASVMCQVLSWAHWAEPKFNPEPDFTFDDLMEFTKGPLANPDIVKQKEKPSCLDDMDDTDLDIDPVTAMPRKAMGQENIDSINVRERMMAPDLDINHVAAEPGMEPCDEHGNPIPGEPSVIVPLSPGESMKILPALWSDQALINLPDKPKEKENMEPKKPRGKQPKPVVQIDPKTLQVVKEWPSMTEAQRELGLSHIDVAVSRLRKCGDFYWSLSADAATFRDRLAEKQRQTDERQKQQAEKMRENKAANKKDQPKEKAEPKPKSLMDQFEEQQHEFEQMKREGIHTVILGRLDPTGEAQPHKAAADALKVFTDEELIAALTERGFEGELTRVQRFYVGKKE